MHLLPGKSLFAPKMPELPPPQAVPDTSSADAERARKAALAQARRRKGFGTSRLTAPLGDTTDVPVRRQTLGA